MTTKSATTKEFQKKVWTATAIVGFVILLVLMIKTLFAVLLLVIAGILIAIYFRGLAWLLTRRFGIGARWSLPLAIILSCLMLFGFFFMAGNRIQNQVQELSETLPTAVNNFKEKLQGSTLGQKFLSEISSPEATKKAGSVIQQFFTSTFGVLGDVYVVLFLGIFFTASPRLYTNGIISLVPPGAKSQAKQLLSTLGESLMKWLKGQLLAMVLVFVLTATGLLIIGVPMWLVLALMAGLLNFIPNFGPLIALIPAVLVGLMQSPTTAILVAALYIFVQVLESNIITPQIQKKLLNIPPALIIIAQLLMGVLTGGWGLVLATPLLVITMVVIHELYVKRQNEA